MGRAPERHHGHCRVRGAGAARQTSGGEATFQGDLLSFPSGHAATSFALATILSLWCPRAAWLFYVLASLIALGRVLGNIYYRYNRLGLDVHVHHVRGQGVRAYRQPTSQAGHHRLDGRRQLMLIDVQQVDNHLRGCV